MNNNQIGSSINPFEFKDFTPQERFYKGYERASSYITMRDGVKIAIDTVLPKNLSPSDKVSIILLQTCYWRDYVFRVPFRWFLKEIPVTKKLHGIGIKRGYGFVYVDVRGTGASFGMRPYPWSEEEVNNGREIIDWIVNQPWSDGNVLTMGTSYLGVAAEYVASLNHPAVKGVAPFHNQWDTFTEVGYPGGIYNHFFIRIWGILGRGLDRNISRSLLPLHPFLYFLVKGVKPVDSDNKKTLLKEALEQHLSNNYVFEVEGLVFFRDDPLPKGIKGAIDSVSVFSKKDKIENSNVPFLCWGSWLDAATADNIINRFMTYKNPMRAVIGDWDHGANRRANPYFHKKYTVIPKKEFQQESWMDFFDACLHGKKPFSEKVLYYYTMGQEKWKITTTWPPKGQTMQKWYLEENSSLSRSKPKAESGEDTYKVDFDVTSGRGNRWHTHFARKMYYNKREQVDQKLLVYTSPPLEGDMEITGHPIITLYLTSTHEDGNIFVYLEDVNETGKVTYVTEGYLRLINRKISQEKPPYKMMVPYHSFKRKDALPIVPGEIVEISFGFLPISVLIRQGHRIRIAITGADKDTFARYPVEGNPTLSIKRNEKYPSFIEIPVIQTTS